ncbi:hypothetical protein ACWDUN_05250 [Mycobacterium sp. NPDC003323]
MDNTLAYIDQGSFLGLRALGRGPIDQAVWIYDRPVDLDGLLRFRRNLGNGLLGRRIERSPLPFGRHRWVADPAPQSLDMSSRECRRSELWSWADDCMRAPIDPEHGPSWRLAVQPFSDGGAAVSLVTSHSIVDGLGLVNSVVDAVNGVDRRLSYPAPNSRTLGRALAQDARQILRSVPSMGRAVVASIKVARAESGDLATSFRSAGDAVGGDDRPMLPPSVVAFVDTEQWDACARRLGGTSNSLFSGVAARVGHRLGRVDRDGLAYLSWPVSERTEGDTRANALVEANMSVDPEQVVTDLSALRAATKKALSESAVNSVRMTGPLPLTPVTPQVMLRRLEGMVLAVNSPIACSNMGELDPAFGRPDGTDADYVVIRGLEPQITSRVLNRIGGQLLLAGCRTRGRMAVAVGSWTVGRTNSKEALRDVVVDALADFGLTGTVEGPAA